MEQKTQKIPLKLEPLPKIPPKLPNGTKKYYFDYYGNLVSSYSPNLFYDTIAISENKTKSAEELRASGVKVKKIYLATTERDG